MSVTMNQIMQAIEKVFGAPLLTPNQCADLAAELRAVLAQEAGKCEAVGYVSFIGNGFVRVRTTENLAIEEPLYTFPPAPVSVVLDEQQEFANWMHEVVEFEHAEITRKIQRRDIMDLKDEKYAWEAWQARACIDKVKELNQ